MPRIRTISASEALFVGPTPATGAHFISGSDLYFTSGTANVPFDSRIRQLFRVQSINDSYNFGNLQPINQHGELGAIDFIVTEPPTVPLSFTYFQSNMANEKSLGFSISSGAAAVGCLSGILNKEQDEKNYFIATRSEGNDVNNNTAAFTVQEYVKGIGNGYITNYTAEASVGNIPTVSVDVEGLNVKIDRADTLPNADVPAIDTTNDVPITGSFYKLPSAYSNLSGLATNVNTQAISALRPGDMNLVIGYNDLGADANNIKIQSYNLQIPLTRQPINQLGNKFSVSREIQFPLTATLSVTALVGDLKTGNLYDIFNDCTGRQYNATIELRSPCGGGTAAGYILRGGRLVSQESTASVGADKAVTLTFQYPIGGPQAVDTNIFFSGISY